MQKVTFKTFKPFWLLWITISLFLFSCSTDNDLPIELQFTEAKLYSPDTSIALPTTLPATVYDALEKAGVIPNPYVSENDEKVQWVSNKRWVYEVEFEVTKELLKKKNIFLIADQLDTYCKVLLNGKDLGNHSSAFYPFEKPLYKKDSLLKLGTNKLEFQFYILDIAEQHSAGMYPLPLPDGTRMHTRKAQFQYGWDWGMVMKDVGIADHVKLIAYDGMQMKEAGVECKEIVDSKATLDLHFEFQAYPKEAGEYIAVFMGKEYPFKLEERKEIRILIEMEDPILWNPHTKGEAYMYKEKLEIKDSKGKVLAEKEIRFGVRTVELVQEELAEGKSFYFKVNGESVFAQGANIIPVDHRYSRMTDEKIKQVVDDAKAANMNMLRVWGGGFYLPEIFYQYCDEQGLMVWQDYMFACAMYPDGDGFLHNVVAEAKHQLVRLRKHPSVVLWCGNNESSEGWHRWGWSSAYSKEDSAYVANSYDRIFRQTLPMTTANHTHVPYWESSPSLGRGDQNYIYSGDAHNWWVWHDSAPFSNFEEEIPRFMSEFGFQSFPSLAAMDSMAQGTWPNAKELAAHQKHSRGFAIIDAYWKRNLPPAKTKEDSVYLTQVLQALGMEKGMRAHKTDEHCGGSLFWQLNDCWPVISWSSVDYYGYWKAMQYRAKEVFRENTIRMEIDSTFLVVFAHQPKVNGVSYQFYHMVNDQIENEEITSEKPENMVTREKGQVWGVDISKYTKSSTSYFKLVATLNGGKDVCIAIKPWVAWKDFEFTPNSLEWELAEDGKSILLKASAFNAFVNIQTPFRKIEDNFFHMEKGEERIIKFPEAVKKEDIKVISLNDF